jgi:hypothetical protein
MQCSPDEESIGEAEFGDILYGVAQGWNEGNAGMAAYYFADDAVYEEPPKKQLYKGKKEIFKFFGGEKGFDKPMKMEWHNIAFNAEQQTGFGEYTFAMNNQYHGVVVIKLREGKIALWREYQYKSETGWREFADESFFETVK